MIGKNLMNQYQILDKVVRISLHTNALEKSTEPYFPANIWVNSKTG